ncbi:unnamed protein product [Lota lota]
MCHVEDQSATVSFFHSLLKKQGKLLIVHEAADSGWAFLWKTYRKTLWPESTSDYLSAGGIRAHLDRLGLRYDVVTAPNCFDITDRFNWDSTSGARLLDFMTVQDHFHQSLTPEVRKGILDLLRNKCSTEKKGRVFSPAPPARIHLRRSLVTVPAGLGKVPVHGAAVTGLLMNTKERRKSDAPTERAEEKEALLATRLSRWSSCQMKREHGGYPS